MSVYNNGLESEHRLTSTWAWESAGTLAANSNHRQHNHFKIEDANTTLKGMSRRTFLCLYHRVKLIELKLCVIRRQDALDYYTHKSRWLL